MKGKAWLISILISVILLAIVWTLRSQTEPSGEEWIFITPDDIEECRWWDVVCREPISQPPLGYFPLLQPDSIS